MHRRHTTGSIDEPESLPDETLTTSSGKKKRFRKAYSCANCRHRKIKCERTFPCHQCELRGIASSCGASTLFHEYIEADVRKKQGLAPRPSQSHSQSQSSLVESPIDTISSGSSKAYSPAQVTLETLHRTVDSFRAQITIVEQQIRSLQSPSSSTMNLTTRETRQRYVDNPLPPIEKSQTKDEREYPIVQQLRELERKVDLIYQRVAMACPSTTTNILPNPFAPTAPPSLMPSKHPELEPAASTSNLVSHRANIEVPMDDMQLDPAITQWLQQETLTTGLDNQYGISDLPTISFGQANASLDDQEAPGGGDHLPPHWI